MSRMYDMQVTIYGHDPEKAQDIQTAAKEIWSFDDFEPGSDDKGNPTALFSRGEGSLGGGMDEDEFTADLSKAIWKANGKFCHVQVHAIYLEDMPFEEHELDEEDYNEMKESLNS